MAAKGPARASLRYAKAPLSPRYQWELHQLLGHCFRDGTQGFFGQISLRLLVNIPPPLFDNAQSVFEGRELRIFASELGATDVTYASQTEK
ncbi:hypothetical protein A3722_14055 [Sulfitobacter sp. HI0027]|nr:hypothetical protein A3722_14055 [Sulfitobacter sp. HI0027]